MEKEMKNVNKEIETSSIGFCVEIKKIIYLATSGKAWNKLISIRRNIRGDGVGISVRNNIKEIIEKRNEKD